MSAYKTEVDVINRALQHLRRSLIRVRTDRTAEAQHTSLAYDRLREAELETNLWRFATRRVVMRPVSKSTEVWTPPAYSASTTYSVGHVITYSGEWWQSKVAANVGNTPQLGDYWRRYYGPDSCDPFLSLSAAPAAPTLTSSASGSLAAQTVYVTVTYLGAGGETVASSESSLALAASHVAVVTSPAAASYATSYNVYASDSTGSETLQNASPITIGTNWTMPTTGLVLGRGAPTAAVTSSSASATSFFPGELVNFNGSVYLSLISANTDVPPTPAWLSVSGTLSLLQILYPVGTGPVTDQSTSNVYRLPVGYLKQAPTSPKSGANPWLGAPKGTVREDWVFEGGYVVSAFAEPLLMRYVANTVDVPDFSAVFCEMLASRIAEETGPVLAEADLWREILANVRAHYRDERTKAVRKNDIEIGPVDPDIDDFLLCRR